MSFVFAFTFVVALKSDFLSFFLPLAWEFLSSWFISSTTDRFHWLGEITMDPPCVLSALPVRPLRAADYLSCQLADTLDGFKWVKPKRRVRMVASWSARRSSKQTQKKITSLRSRPYHSHFLQNEAWWEIRVHPTKKTEREEGKTKKPTE